MTQLLPSRLAAVSLAAVVMLAAWVPTVTVPASPATAPLAAALS